MPTAIQTTGLVMQQAVANGGTFSIKYPIDGKGAQRYIASASTIYVNDVAYFGKLSIVSNATDLTITNNTGQTIAAGAKVMLWLVPELGSPEAPVMGGAGDGVTDDTVAFQAFLDAGGGELQYGKVYAVKTLNVPANTQVLGNGARVLRHPATTAASSWWNLNGSNISLENFILDGNSTLADSYTGPIMSYNGSFYTKGTFQDLELINPHSGWHFGITGINDLRISRCKFSGGHYYCIIGGGINNTIIKGVKIIDNEFTDYGFGNGGIHLAATPSAGQDIQDVVIAENRFTTSGYWIGQISAVNTGTDVITVTTASHITYTLQTGDALTALAMAGLPFPAAGIVSGSDVYVIPVTSNSFKVASSLANVNAGIAIDLTAANLGNFFRLHVNQIPIELFSLTAPLVVSNEISGGGYGISSSSNGGAYVDNVIRNQSVYAMEFGPSGVEGQDETTLVADNKIIDCVLGITCTGPRSGLNIRDNDFRYTIAGSMLLGSSITPLGRKIRIRDNSFVNPTQYCVYPGSGQGLEDSDIIANDVFFDADRPTFGVVALGQQSPDPILFVISGRARNLRINNNTYNTSVDGGSSGINQGVVYLASSQFEDIEIHDNSLKGEIASTFGTSNRMKTKGIYLSGTSQRNVSVRRNVVQGFLNGYLNDATAGQGVVLVDNSIYNNDTDIALGAADLITYPPPIAANLGGATAVNTTGTSNGTTLIKAVGSLSGISVGMKLYFNPGAAVLRTVTAISGGFVLAATTVAWDVAGNGISDLGLSNKAMPPSGTAMIFSGGTPPTGVTLGTTYFWVNTLGESGVHFGRLATTYQKAISHSPDVTLSGTPSGTTTVSNSPCLLLDNTVGASGACTIVSSAAGVYAVATGLAPLAAATGTIPASPGVYQNQTGYVQDVYLYGGTVTLVDTGPDNSTWANLITLGGVALVGQCVRLQPSEFIRVTHTVAPTYRTVNRGR